MMSARRGCFDEPVRDHPQMGFTMPTRGIWGLVVLVADVWAIVSILQSPAETARKVLWVVLVIVLPVVGFILWYFLGPKSGRA